MAKMESEVHQKTGLVIFGVTGDLTFRKLVPAIFQIIKSGQLNQSLHIYGFARRDWDHNKLVAVIRDSISKEYPNDPDINDVLLNLQNRVEYIQSDFDDDAGYRKLVEHLTENQISNVLFYLATPPESYIPIIKNIGLQKLSKEDGGWRRIIIEKPYGVDSESADRLESKVHTVFKENQVYRIDHYLGKETVQNILVFRFANGIFEPLWNRRYIDHVQITVAETVGVETRAGYYENAGVVRDVFQNHLLQLLTLVAMEAPVAFNANSVRDEKVKVLHALRELKGEDVIKNTIRGQYGAGIMDTKSVISYRDEPGVSPRSTTETYLATRMFVDSWRWSGVPFYLRSGKRLPKRLTEIAIQFKQVPLALFKNEHIAFDAPNCLVLNLQPDEGITLSFGAKIPGIISKVQPVNMKFSYKDTFGSQPPDAYQRLLLDCLAGDATLFTRSDEVREAWNYTSNIIDAWNAEKMQNLPLYEAGSWGPSDANDFIKKDGRVWRYYEPL